MSTRNLLLPAIALTALLGVRFTPVASAQLITSVSMAAPTTNVQISNTAAPGNNGTGNPQGQDNIEGDTNGRKDGGETFTVGTTGFSMNAFTIQIAAVGMPTPGAAVTLSLFSYANNTTPTPSTTLGTFTGTLPSLTVDASGNTYYNTHNVFLTLAFPAKTLLANGVYGVELGFNTQGVANQDINFFISYGSSYSGGVQTTFNGTTYAATNNDFTSFYVTSVPEPSHYAMMAVGGLVLLVTCRRRSRA